MPSQSAKQHRFMEMVANDPAAAKRVGVPQTVGQDFVAADAGQAFPKKRKKAKAKLDDAIGVALAKHGKNLE